MIEMNKWLINEKKKTKDDLKKERKKEKEKKEYANDTLAIKPNIRRNKIANVCYIVIETKRSIT